MNNKDKFPPRSEHDYRFNVVGRSVLVTDAMKNYAQEKIAKIERFHPHTIDVIVTMDIQKIDHVVDIMMNFSHFHIRVHAVTSDMYASIDRAVEKLQHKLRRWKERIQDHHNKPQHEIDLKVNVLELPVDEVSEINDAIESSETAQYDYSSPMTKLVGTEQLQLRMLTAEEAVMRMELSGDHFLVFKGEEDRALKVIYRREDGNYGIIQAQ